VYQRTANIVQKYHSTWYTSTRTWRSYQCNILTLYYGHGCVRWIRYYTNIKNDIDATHTVINVLDKRRQPVNARFASWARTYNMLCTASVSRKTVGTYCLTYIFMWRGVCSRYLFMFFYRRISQLVSRNQILNFPENDVTG